MSLPSAPPSSSSDDIRIRLSDLAGERFKDLFYSIFDAKRQDLGRFFTSRSVLLWEGVPKQGKEEIEKFFDSLPPTKHTISSLDIQQVSPSVLLISIAGSVIFGIDAQTPKGFFHSFVIEQQSVLDPTSGRQKPLHFIVSGTFRSRNMEKETSAVKKIIKYHQ